GVALALLDVEIDAADDLHVAEGFIDAAKAERKFSHAALRSGLSSLIRPSQPRRNERASSANQDVPTARHISAASQGSTSCSSILWPNSPRVLPCAAPMVRKEASSTTPTKPSTMTRQGRITRP